MQWKRVALGASVLAAGCQAKPPAPVVQTPPASIVTTPPPTEQKQATVMALIEPYLVAVDGPEKIYVPPPSLGGRITPTLPEPSPLIPSPPLETETRPVAPPRVTAPISPKTKPKTPTRSISAMVRLLEEERGRSVEIARQHLASATARVGQTTTEAKKTWDLVRAGALAQFKANQADAAVRDATTEQATAQKDLEEAQQRQRNARQDVEAALGAIAESVLPFTLAQLPTLVTTYRPMPGTYRLSILGPLPSPELKVENGTLGRSLERAPGEAGAWILRCADPTKVRLSTGEAKVTVIVRSLPPAGIPKPKA